MLRKGLAAPRVVSHVKMLPLACPPAMVVWSAETAIEVMGPDSTAAGNQWLAEQLQATTTDLLSPGQ